MKEFYVPSSKSITNRLLIIRYLSQSVEPIINASQAQDSLLLKDILGNIDSNQDTFFCNNAGTSTRFVTALLALKKGLWHLDASQRMKQRPLEPLISALQMLGAKIQTSNNTFPLTIEGGFLHGDKTLSVDSRLSSQFLSSLLLIAPCVKGGLTFLLSKNTSSIAYVELTLWLMQQCGAKIKREQNKIIVAEGKYIFHSMQVENDWASALFACEQIAIQKRGEVLIKNLSLNSHQPERRALQYFSLFGVEALQNEKDIVISYNPQKDIANQKSTNKVIQIELTNCIDSFAPLAASALFCGCKVVFKGIEPLKHKESNRIVAMQEGLQSLKATTFVSKDSFVINGFSDIKENITIRTFADHRIAMTFYILGLRINGLKIDDKVCIAKSFPSFFSNF
jgi:5-enolpyruvylshikimate-3-phosphate synthase